MPAKPAKRGKTESKMKKANIPDGQDVFLWLKCPTVVVIRSVFKWAHKNALKTGVSCLDVSKSWSRGSSDKNYSELVNLISRNAKP